MGRRPNPRERLVEIEVERLTGVVAGVEQSPASMANCQGAYRPPCPAGTAIVRVISSIGARSVSETARLNSGPTIAVAAAGLPWPGAPLAQ